MNINDVFLSEWVVDSCCDADGNWTVRVADGSEHGDTTMQPIATYYNRSLADAAVQVHNHVLSNACGLRFVEDVIDE
jgi:hypothetical protein